MLAPLGFYLFLTVIECAAILMVCWVVDAHSAETAASRTHRSQLKLTVYPYARSSGGRFRATTLSAREGMRGRHRGGLITRADGQSRLGSVTVHRT
jgi:hypothetical protein